VQQPASPTIREALGRVSSGHSQELTRPGVGANNCTEASPALGCEGLPTVTVRLPSQNPPAP
jgi:hypothetical protein